MISGRLRRRALALLGALLLVILIWPPCCATMPKPLPAVLPTVPEIDLPSDPVPAVSIASPIQHQQQQSSANKSRKVSELSRFMNVLLVGNYDDDRGDTGESEEQRSSTQTGDSRRVSSASSSDDQNRTTLNLRRPENNTAGYSIEQSIDKNKSNVQQTADYVAAVRPIQLDNTDHDNPTTASGMLTTKPYHTNQITHSPTIYSILFRRTAPPPASSSPPVASAVPQVRSVVPTSEPAVRSQNEVIDRGSGDDDPNAVNQSVFNPTDAAAAAAADAFISDISAEVDDDHRSRSPSWPVLSRVGRSAGSPPHPHRHQHYLSGNGTLMAPGRGRGAAAAGRHLHHHHQPHQNQHRNGTGSIGGGGGATGGDSSNLERNERSANLSHITGANRKIQLYIKNRYLQLLADGTVNGTHDDQSDFTILQRTTVAAGQIRIQGVATCLFLCMDTCGTVYGSKDFTDDCVFNEQMEQHHYNTYSSTQHSNSRRTLYLALNKTGQPRKIQIPVNRTLGKLATYTKALTQTVAHDRVERLISRLFGANHVRHGLKQLCETGRALQDLTEKVMRPRAACGPAKAPQNVGPTGAGSTAASAASGGNKDKDSKDNMRKKKKKRRKCREDEAPGEHCFRPQSGSLGTNSGRKRPPGQAKSQKCSPEDGDCVVSLSSSSSSSSSSSGSPNSANSVSISRSSSSSSSSNRPSASQATVPNAGAQPPGAGPKKKVIKKVNSKNTPSNVNSNNNKKPKKGPGGSGGGPNASKKAKQQQQNSSSSSSGSSASSSSSSSSTVPSVLRGRAKTTPARRAPSLRSASSTTSSSTTATTPSRPSITTPANLDDTSQSEDDLEAELEADDLVHSSAEFIEEEDLDEGNINLTGQSLNFVDEEDLDDMDF
nr:uncharacterized protein LOC115271075 isoform X2 [Aedes albopictus]